MVVNDNVCEPDKRDALEAIAGNCSDRYGVIGVSQDCVMIHIKGGTGD